MDTHKKITDEITLFLEKLDIVPDSIDSKEHKLHHIFSIHTKDSALLIGNNGETLQALNYLIKKIFQRNSEEDTKFLIDVNGYQEKKIEQLEKQAELSADRVRAFKREVELEPTNAYERMIIHALFTNDPHIETFSVGEGRFRRVVLKFVGE